MWRSYWRARVSCRRTRWEWKRRQIMRPLMARSTMMRRRMTKQVLREVKQTLSTPCTGRLNLQLSTQMKQRQGAMLRKKMVKKSRRVQWRTWIASFTVSSIITAVQMVMLTICRLLPYPLLEIDRLPSTRSATKNRHTPTSTASTSHSRISLTLKISLSWPMKYSLGSLLLTPEWMRYPAGSLAASLFSWSGMAAGSSSLALVTQLTSCSKSARTMSGSAVKTTLQRAMQQSSQMGCPEKAFLKEKRKRGTVKRRLLQVKQRIISLMRMQFHRPCTKSSRQSILNSGRAQSLACTAFIPSSPQIPTPMCASFIIDTSLPPSPTDRHTFPSRPFTIRTASDFCEGSILQQTRLAKWSVSCANCCSASSFANTWARTAPSTTRQYFLRVLLTLASQSAMYSQMGRLFGRITTTSYSCSTSPHALPISTAVSSLSPVSIHTLMLALCRSRRVCGTSSCNSSSSPVAPRMVRFFYRLAAYCSITSYLSLREAIARSLMNSCTSLSETMRAAMRRERRPLRESASMEAGRWKGEGAALSKMTLSAPLTQRRYAPLHLTSTDILLRSDEKANLATTQILCSSSPILTLTDSLSLLRKQYPTCWAISMSASSSGDSLSNLSAPSSWIVLTLLQSSRHMRYSSISSVLLAISFSLSPHDITSSFSRKRVSDSRRCIASLSLRLWYLPSLCLNSQGSSPMTAVWNLSSFLVMVPVLSQKTYSTCPSSSLRAAVRAQALRLRQVLNMSWSKSMKQLCAVLTISMLTMSETGMHELYSMKKSRKFMTKSLLWEQLRQSRQCWLSRIDISLAVERAATTAQAASWQRSSAISRQLSFLSTADSFVTKLCPFIMILEHCPVYTTTPQIQLVFFSRDPRNSNWLLSLTCRAFPSMSRVALKWAREGEGASPSNLPASQAILSSLQCWLRSWKAYLILLVCSPSSEEVSIYAIPSLLLELMRSTSAGNISYSPILHRSPTQTYFHLIFYNLPPRSTVTSLLSLTSLSVLQRLQSSQTAWGQGYVLQRWR